MGRSRANRVCIYTLDHTLMNSVSGCAIITTMSSALGAHNRSSVRPFFPCSASFVLSRIGFRIGLHNFL